MSRFLFILKNVSFCNNFFVSLNSFKYYSFNLFVGKWIKQQLRFRNEKCNKFLSQTSCSNTFFGWNEKREIQLFRSFPKNPFSYLVSLTKGKITLEVWWDWNKIELFQHFMNLLTYSAFAFFKTDFKFQRKLLVLCFRSQKLKKASESFDAQKEDLGECDSLVHVLVFWMLIFKVRQNSHYFQLKTVFCSKLKERKKLFIKTWHIFFSTRMVFNICIIKLNFFYLWIFKKILRYLVTRSV